MQLDIEPFIPWLVVIHSPTVMDVRYLVRYEEAVSIRDAAREAHPDAVITIAVVDTQVTPEVAR